MQRPYIIRLLVLIAITLLQSIPGIAQEYRFHTINTRNGLSNNSVNALLVDSRGFLWVGTELGLNRYDGYNITRYYDFNNGNRNPISNVTDLKEDALGNIWIDCDLPNIRYDYRNRCFRTDNNEYLKQMGFSVAENMRVLVDSEGSLWMLSNGLIQYKNLSDGDQEKVRSWKVNLKVSQPREVTIKDYNGMVFITDRFSVYCFNSRTGRLQRIVLPEIFSTDRGHLRIYIDLDGRLWVYSMLSEHICTMPVSNTSAPTLFSLPSYSTTGQTPSHLPSANNAIRNIFDDGQGHMWIATDHEGVFTYDKWKKEHKFTHLRHNASEPLSLPSDNVTSIICDRQGTVWMGHLNTGLSYSNPRNNIFSHNGNMCGEISTMLFDQMGNLWLGTDGNGLFVRHTDGTFEKTALPNITISSLLEDSNGSMWVGTYQNGLIHMNGTKQYTIYNKENGHLPHNSVWQMVEDGKGNIWFTSVFNPIAKFNIATEKASLYSNKGENVTGISLINDGKGNIYCGTYYGIWIYDTTTGHAHYAMGNNKGTQKFMQFAINSMCLDKQNSMLWIAHKTGITVWDTKRDTLYYIDNTNGLLDSNIKSIVRDASGSMWVSTDRGVSCIRTLAQKRQNGDNNNNGKSQMFSIRNFTVSEDVQNYYFNNFAATSSNTGDVYFGGNNGYTEIRPKSMATEVDKPSVQFTDVSIGDSILTPPNNADWGKSALDLNYDDYQINIHFFTGNLISVNRVMYAYRLKGMREEWTYTETNTVSFFSLAPGSYTLEVKASGEDGEWGEVSSLQINVAPPFYYSWWMIVIYILLGLAALYFVISFMQLRQQKHMEEEKKRIEQEQIVQLSEMKLRFFTNISHDLRTPLTLIISPLQSLLSENLSEGIAKRLSVINKNAQLLLNQVNMLLDFRRLDVGAENLKLQSIEVVHFISDVCLSFDDYAKERNIQLSYTHTADMLFMNIDAEKLNKIMYNLLSNAFKFTPDGGKIGIDLADGEKEMTISVSDTGPGIADADKKLIFQRFYQVNTNNPKAGSGIGLHIVNEYVRLHGGDIEVKDNTPSGAIFKFSIPKTEAKSESAPQALADTHKAVAEGSTSADENTQFSVLVVDDNRDLCTFVADSLRSTYNIFMAYDGEEALQVLQQEDINLVVSDIMMPRIDGLELCRRIKTDLKWSHIPVILLTAKSADMSIIEGLQQGADDYITKPFNIEHLRLRIQKFIEWTTTSHRAFNQRIEVEPSEITITSLDEEFVKSAILLVEQNISDSDFSVDMLGKELGMSRTNLYKKLTNITGKGPHEFIRTIRMKRAYRLLEKSQMQISEIAYEVGYSSPKRFSENFKNEFGMTPSEFLRSRK